jgi:hypothetical protein
VSAGWVGWVIAGRARGIGTGVPCAVTGVRVIGGPVVDVKPAWIVTAARQLDGIR